VSDTEEKSGKNYIASALFAAIVVIPLTMWIAPDLIPWSYFGAWDGHGTGPVEWLMAGWPIFAWGFGFTLLVSIIKKVRGDTLSGRLFDDLGTRGEMLWEGTKASLIAGITEEIAFRWLIYYGAFAGITIINFLFFGWAGFGLPELFHNYVWGPLANWTTFGYLEQWILNPNAWIVGAAMLYANAFFRDGHKYQGLFGMINSWFIGMFLFYIMFTYGLLAAIVIHFVYDWLIFTTVALIWGE
jgi:hypothetical protein